MDIQGYRATPEGVNTRKCIRACARGIVYTLKKDPRALALHLLHPQLRAVPVEATRLSPRRVSGLRLQGPRQRGRTPAWTRHGLPVKSSSTVRERARLRPSLRVLGSVLRSQKNGPSNKRVTKCTENPVLWGGGSARCAGRWHTCKVGRRSKSLGGYCPRPHTPTGRRQKPKLKSFLTKAEGGRGAQNL